MTKNSDRVRDKKNLSMMEKQLLQKRRSMRRKGKRFVKVAPPLFSPASHLKLTLLPRAPASCLPRFANEAIEEKERGGVCPMTGD